VITRRGLLMGGLAVGALLLGLYLGRRDARTPPDLSSLEPALSEAAREMGVDPNLLRALVAAESGGDPKAVSRAGALGLTQLLPSTAKEEAQRRGLGAVDERALLDDPRLNLRLGAGYLARQLERFGGEPVFALAAYNAGATNLLRWREKAPDASPLEVVLREGFPATRAYVRKVLDLRAAYRSAE
jgi:soluble lytic murein transglycosylase